MNQENKIPELLLPAGNLEKLKIACLYGADAVYLAGQKFGLRSAADNFTPDELKEGVKFAHDRKVKVYVVLNSFLHNKDFDGLQEFIQYLDSLKVDAVIVSDIGVAKFIKKYSSIPLHVSTQASVINSGSALFWKDQGATRVVVGRELSIKDAFKIKEKTGLEIEMFVHGSMCMAFSGHCTISNFTQGRDSNRGGCAHSCRFEYSLDMDSEEKKRAYFMSSKDLKGLTVIEEFYKYGIDSLKVEGRMKSPLYVATMGKVYKEALMALHEKKLDLKQMQTWEKELNKVPHREYTQASLISKADSDSIFNEREHKEKEWEIAAVVVEKSHQSLIVEIKNAFNIGDELEFLPFNGEAIPFKVMEMTDLLYQNIDRTKPSTLVRLPLISSVENQNIIRKRLLQ